MEQRQRVAARGIDALHVRYVNDKRTAAGSGDRSTPTRLQFRNPSSDELPLQFEYKPVGRLVRSNS